MAERALIFLVIVSATSAIAAPSPERQGELLHRLRHDCGACHGLTLKGGLGPALLPGDLAGRSNKEIEKTILLGRPGTPMPPWAFEISPDEATWLVEQLKEGLDNGAD